MKLRLLTTNNSKSKRAKIMMKNLIVLVGRVSQNKTTKRKISLRFRGKLYWESQKVLNI